MCLASRYSFILTACFLTTYNADGVVADYPSSPGASTERPGAPEGFQWQELKEIDGAILLPNGWHFKTSITQDGVVYRLTKEQLVDQQGRFLTGMTITVVHGVKAKTNLAPSLYAVHYVDTYMKGADEIVAEPWRDRIATFSRVRCQVIKRFPIAGTDRRFRISLTTFANDATGTLYVLIFGAPKEEWEDAQKIEKQLLNPILLSAKQ